MESAARAESRFQQRQLGIIDIFSGVTIVALLLAVFAPWLREMEAKQLWWFLGVASLQWATAIIVFMIQSYRKRSIQRSSGKLLGIGHQTEVKMEAWPKLQATMTLVMMAGVQVFIAYNAASLASVENQVGWISYVFLFNSLQLGVNTGWVLFSFLSGIYGSAALFYANGISFRLSKLISWDELEVRHSTIFKGRVVIVTPGPLKSTLVFQVSPELRAKLIEMSLLPELPEAH